MGEQVVPSELEMECRKANLVFTRQLIMYFAVLFNADTYEVIGELNSKGVMEIIIAKNRNGITGSIYVNHNESITKIQDELFESPSLDSTIGF